MHSREFERLKKNTGKGCVQGFIWEIEAPGDGLLILCISPDANQFLSGIFFVLG